MALPRIAYLALSVLFLSACSCKKSPDVQFIGEVKKLVRKSPQQIAAVLGKGKSKEDVKGFPCEHSDCEKRNYRNGQFEVIYKNKKSDRITIHKVPDYTDNENALESLGLPQQEPFIKTPKTIATYSNVEGIREISFFPDYIVIQVTEPD